MKIAHTLFGLVLLALGPVAARADCPVVLLGPTTLADASVGQPYTPVNFSATPADTYTFDATGLPAGLTLAPNGTLSGTSTGIGSFVVQVAATSSTGCVATRELTLASCLSLAVGAAYTGTMPEAADLCFADPTSGFSATEYTYVPVNTATTDISLTITGTGIQAVAGPPTPRPAGGGDNADHALDLQPLVDAGAAARTVELPQENLSYLLAPERRARSLVDVARPQGGSSPPAVGALLDLNVNFACSGSPDIRKGRVEAVSAATGAQRYYAVQEVVDDGAGGWTPAVAGGFATIDFQNIVDAFTTPVPAVAPFATPNGSGLLGGLTFNDGRGILAANFGAYTDIDNNGGTLVFFTKKLNELSPPASATVNFANFATKDIFATSDCSNSNVGEIIYILMPDPTGAVNSNVRTLSFVYGNAERYLGHFSEHLVNAFRRAYVTSASFFEQTWLNEALASNMEELMFFSASAGLAPRQNIDLAALTTGPNASRRVAAFNTFANPTFGGVRSFFLQRSAGKHGGPLRISAVSGATTHDSIASDHNRSAQFLRYAIDRKIVAAGSGSDSTFFNALVNSNLEGVPNVNNALGIDAVDWARDFDMAMYADDNAFAIASMYATPSWNFRSVYSGLGGFQLVVAPLADGVGLTLAYSGGDGLAWARFARPAGAVNAKLHLDQSGGPPPATTQVVVDAHEVAAIGTHTRAYR